MRVRAGGEGDGSGDGLRDVTHVTGKMFCAFPLGG